MRILPAEVVLYQEMTLLCLNSHSGPLLKDVSPDFHIIWEILYYTEQIAYFILASIDTICIPCSLTWRLWNKPIHLFFPKTLSLFLCQLVDSWHMLLEVRYESRLVSKSQI